MKNKTTLSLFLMTLAFGCTKTNKIPDGKLVLPNEMALVIGNPVSYGETNLLVFPIGANYNPQIEDHPETEAEKRIKENQNLGLSANKLKLNGSFTIQKDRTYMYDTQASSEFSNSNEADFDMRNILFYNKQSGQSYFVSSDTLHFLSFAIHREFDKSLIFYRVVKVDINKDKKYDSKDAVMLYVSDTEGKNFTQITPANEQFFEYFYYPETQVILIKTALDIDKDQQFTELDETVFREMRLSAPAFGKEIFTQSMKDSLKSQISVFK